MTRRRPMLRHWSSPSPRTSIHRTLSMPGHGVIVAVGPPVVWRPDRGRGRDHVSRERSFGFGRVEYHLRRYWQSPSEDCDGPNSHIAPSARRMISLFCWNAGRDMRLPSPVRHSARRSVPRLSTEGWWEIGGGQPASNKTGFLPSSSRPTCSA